MDVPPQEVEGAEAWLPLLSWTAQTSASDACAATEDGCDVVGADEESTLGSIPLSWSRA